MKNRNIALCIIFSIITCGIYGFYWNYRMGQKIDSVKNGSNAVLFLILSIFGLGIVNYCIAQSFINDRVA